LGTPEGAGFDQLVDRLVDARLLGFQALEQRLEGALRDAVLSVSSYLGDAWFVELDWLTEPGR
jgi:hypothetical protein